MDISQNNLNIEGENLPTFIYIFDNFGDYDSELLIPEENEALNNILKTLQKKQAKNLDVKVSVCALPTKNPPILGIYKIYLIKYEADKQLL